MDQPPPPYTLHNNPPSYSQVAQPQKPPAGYAYNRFVNNEPSAPPPQPYAHPPNPSAYPQSGYPYHSLPNTQRMPIQSGPPQQGYSQPVAVPWVRFDGDARFSSNCPAVIPPPPPGYAPNAAQQLSQSGYNVQVQQGRHRKDPGWTMW